ncbi:MAG: OprO/OprP family phosphate-selective porin [Thermocrinis sp.]|nr:OprO/OprP family phosphate-selective porin [Thermocrinis sp.]
MRKSLLAMAALMGVATLPAHAWRVNIDKDTYADILFGAQITGTVQGKRTNADKEETNFAAKLVSIGASGQVNKLVYFGILAEAAKKPGLRESFVVRDAFVGLKFADEFRVQAGAMRIPFSRITLTSSYNLLIPTQDDRGIYGVGLSIDPIDGLSVRGDAGERNRDAGIVVWGIVADGILKYYLGVTDGRYDRRGGFFGANTKDNLAYTIRLQITPTILGFKPETGYSLADTYLGKQNVHNVGIGYRVVKAETTGLPRNYSKTAKLFTVDVIYEQKFGELVPNFQVGYIQAKDVAYSYNPTTRVVSYGKATQIYAQGQLLYDQVVGFGKPALAIRWEQNKNKDRFSFDTNTGRTSPIAGEPKNTRVGVFVNYYIKGQDAKISLGVDTVNRNRDSKGANGKNFTDFTLYLQTRF